MSQWTDRIRNHAVWKQLETLGPIIDRATEREGNSTSVVVGLERLKTVLNYSRKRLAAIDLDLTQPTSLGTVNDSLVGIASQVQTFADNGDEEHLTNANLGADGILNALATFSFPCQTDDLTVISEAAASYRNALEKFLNEAAESNQKAQETVANLATKLAELGVQQAEFGAKASVANVDLTVLSKEIDEQRKLISAALAEQQSNFANSQMEIATAYTTSETNRQTSFTNNTAEHQRLFLSAEAERQAQNAASLVSQSEQHVVAHAARQSEYMAAAAENQKQFIEAQVERQKSYAAVVADYTKKLADQNIEFSNQREAMSKDSRAKLEQLQSEYEESAKQIHEKVIQHNTEVEILVGIIGNTGVTSGYLNTANRAQRGIQLWQAITVLTLIVLASGAVYIFGKGAESWEALASRLLTSLPVIVLAAYAGSQADKYQQIEKRNRKLALELAAIGPYLAPLPTEMQNQFRLDIGGRSFGHHDDINKVPDKSPATALDLIDELSKSDKAKEWVMSLIKTARGS